MREREVVGEAFKTVVAVEVEEAHRLAADDLPQLRGADGAAVALHRFDPAEVGAVAAAIGHKALLHPGVRPIEGVEAVGAARHRRARARGAMKKRPSKVPISAIEPLTPSSV